jgi:hypothetical protein
MWTIIIIFTLTLIGAIVYSISKGEYEKGFRFENFMFFIANLLLAVIVAGFSFFAVFFGSVIYVSEATDPPKKLVDTENYFLTEIDMNTYVSISSNKYCYGVKDKTAIHLNELKADKNTFIYVYEDTYTEEERPMVFIDHYVIGGTTFIDYFTFCEWLSPEEYVSFYIPEGGFKTTSFVISD